MKNKGGETNILKRVHVGERGGCLKKRGGSQPLTNCEYCGLSRKFYPAKDMSDKVS